MNTLMFYKKPAALHRELHRNLRLKAAAENYSYAASSNSVQLGIVEFPGACIEYPIVFAQDQNGGPPVPVALIGLREGENLYVTPDGKWEADFVPASVRCYPFAMQLSPDGTEFVVLLDEDYAGFGTEEGERLLTDEGAASPLMDKMISFLHEFYASEKASLDFVMRLKKLDLLVPHAIEMNGPNNTKYVLNGFNIVDEARLKTLGDAALLELTRSGDLGIICAHLISLQNLRKLTRRLEARIPAGLAA